MVKRELVADMEVDLNAPLSKRPKDGEEATSSKGGDSVPPERQDSSDREEGNSGNVEEAPPSMSPEEVREEGLKVLQVLKDAVNKEGRQISYDFQRLPSKRQFPDYYEIIKHPVALEDVKIQLENHAFASLDALREELETCFRNARRYNQRESVIWKDAKTLQKLANKEIDKILRKGKEDDEGTDKEAGKKKEKGVNIHRLMKNRLLKLVAKTDENERRLSDPFMELPNRKKWAIYYKLVPKPVCIEDIFKRIKRKEYRTIPEFINDVDLVFSNAMEFNEEHSPIWVDALTLKTYFHQIMTDLPAKYNMHGANAESSAHPEGSRTKIKIKLPGHHPAAHSNNAEARGYGEASTAAPRFRVPKLSAAGGDPSTATGKDESVTPETNAQTASPAAPSATLPSASSIQFSTHTSTVPPPATTVAAMPGLVMPTPKPARGATSAQAKLTSVAQTPSQQQQTSAYTPHQQYATPSHIPTQNFYTPTAPSTVTPARGSATPAPSVPQTASATGRTDAPSPVPPPSAAGLYSARLECCPPGKSELRRRLAVLDSHAGVRNFALRVPITEAKLIIRAVKLSLHDADGDEGSDGEEDTKTVQSPTKKRGRGRPRKVLSIDQEVKPPEPEQETAPHSGTEVIKEKREKGGREWRFATSSEVEVRIDGRMVMSGAKDVLKVTNALVNGNTESSPGSVNSEGLSKPEDEWSVDLTVGQHVLEISRKGNSVPWKVYLTVT